MGLFKCKMCGGDLEIAEGLTIAECEYCGTKQTVPKAMDENLQILLNRANTLRIKCEFDKAEALYEKLIQVDATQSEAYWGLILCKYGIEYVDDPMTFKKIPTCHRASYDSIVADDDYKSALEHADASQRALYEEQAREIDRIQKEILALAQKEEAYDVFICYKETDANGLRTLDSVIANDIYYQLTQEGFKVFYAAITLEGKLGSSYEPIIFAALNSAKVMLCIGTKQEHFNAVWVKNEWSRFLKIIQKDRSKLLIPCYRDMDAYELPEEFAHLQAQNMAKIGFINDLVRGIKKVIQKDEPKETAVVRETVVTVANNNLAPLLERAFMFLEDGNWNRADDFCEQVLNLDPKNAQAYVGKLMAELRVRKQENLKECATPFDQSGNYQKAVRFADDELKSTLTGYIEYINDRNEKARIEGIYQSAVNVMKNARSEKDYKKAAEEFNSVGTYKDAAALAKKCLEQAEIARQENGGTAGRKKTKTIIAVSCLAIIAVLVGALFMKPNNPNSGYDEGTNAPAAQKLSDADFLENMQKGLKDRWEMASKEEGKYSEYVNAEFEHLGAFSDYEFTDAALEKLAEDYFNALNVQLDTSGQEDDSKVAAWNRAARERRTIIYQLWKDHSFTMKGAYASMLAEQVALGEIDCEILKIEESVKAMSIEHAGANRYNFAITNTSDINFDYAELRITGYDANGVNIVSNYSNCLGWAAGGVFNDHIYLDGEFETATAQMIVKYNNHQDVASLDPVDIEVIDDLVIVLDIPSLPKTVSYFSSSGTEYSRCNVTDITYEMDQWHTDGTGTLSIYFSGEKTYDKSGSSYSRVCRFVWKLYDESGAVVDSGVCQTSKCSVGEQFKNEKSYVYNLTPGTYRLEILNDT